MAKGNNTFKLSDLIPNSWFYKLKNMRGRGNRAREARNSKVKSQISRTEPPKSPTIQHYTANRLSYYIPSRDRAAEKLPLYPSPPKKSKKKAKNKPLSSSVLNSQPAPASPLRRLDGVFDPEFISSPSDFVTYDPSLHLPPILTKSRLITQRKQSPKQGSLHFHGNMKSPSGTQQIKLRIKSPKLVQKRVVKRKELSESFVVVKSSSDPKKDFRESMVDMIVENNLFSWQELEELLACYLLLNSSEFHDLIIEVFEKIWLDITQIIV